MALDAEIQGKKVEAGALNNASELTDLVLDGELKDLFPFDELEKMESQVFLEKVDLRLESLEIEYVEEGGSISKMAIVIGKGNNTEKYVIDSPESFQNHVEDRVQEYVVVFNSQLKDNQTALLVEEVDIKVTLLATTDAVQQLEGEILAEQSPVIKKQIETIQQQPTPTIEQLAANTKLAETIKEYAADNDLDTTAVYEKIRKTQKETLERFFVGIDGSEKFMESVSTATSLYLFSRYTSDDMSDARTSIFAQAQNLNIEKDETDFFGKMQGWAGGLDIGALMQVSGMFKFFMVFRDPGVQEALKKAAGGKTDMVMNHYLENPYQMLQLMQNYDTQTKDKTERLKKELIEATLGSEDTIDAEILSNYTITQENKAAMTKIINDYGGDKGEFENFMGYVEQGETILGQVEGIKEGVLQSEQAASIIENIAMLKQSMETLGTALGFKKEDLAIFDFFDGILGWLGFDGVDGYLEERSAEKHLKPLLEAYKATEKESNPEEIKKTTYGTLLEKITEESAMKADITRLGMAIDPKALYTVMNGENSANFDYATEASLHKLIPEFQIGEVNYETEEEKFLAASAFIMRSMCVSGVLGDLKTVSTEKVVKKLMLYLGDPAKAAKEFDITKSFALAYEGNEYTTRMTNLSKEQNQETTVDGVAPEEIVVDDPVEEQVSVYGNGTVDTGSAVGGVLAKTDLTETTKLQGRRRVAAAMYALIAHDKNNPIDYANDNHQKPGEAARLDDDNEVDCSGMVCEVFRRSGIDNSPRTARGFFRQNYEHTLPLIDQQGSLQNMNNMQPGDLIFWSKVNKDNSTGYHDLEREKKDYNIHHVAMVMNTNPEDGTINILEVNTGGFINRNISPVDIMNRRGDQLLVANMPYDAVG